MTRLPPPNRTYVRGLTLIELMAVLAVVSILALIAYPSYLDQVRKSRRAVAKSALLEIANREEQYFFSARAYTNDLTVFGYSSPTYFSKESGPTTVPADAVYQLTAATTGCGTAPCFIITASTLSGTDQDNDLCKSFTLNSRNERTASDTRCW